MTAIHTQPPLSPDTPGILGWVWARASHGAVRGLWTGAETREEAEEKARADLAIRRAYERGRDGR